MTAMANQLRQQGIPVIGLSAGEPDFPTPQPIVSAAMEALSGGRGFTYTDNTGLLALRREISIKLKNHNYLEYSPNEIICSNGGKQSVAQALMVLCRPGDEVLIPAPYWVSYPEMTVLAGGTPVPMPTSVMTEYRITPNQLEAAITQHTRVLILCSPSNPTGSVYSPEELKAVADVLSKYPNVWVISDELYEHVIFDAKHISFASLKGMKERTITINGFSKAYAMTGWRLGYAAGPLDVVKAMDKVQSQTTSNPSHLSQLAGIAALQMDFEPIAQMVRAFRERRDTVLALLNDIDGIKCPKPEGAFYLFPDVSSFFGKTAPDGNLIQTAEELALYLLREAHVATVAGEGFGDPNGLRISYATSLDKLVEACHRMKVALDRLQ
ncbi:MAG: pyridoxal phosphate-dependent aminotransferase [Bacteroidetes Order II. Incertae sedis bacterium]|nr:pyridoxal phosphate-dependent aminotransferase [Bacteroidetes Order II. bacterium]